MTDMKRVTVAIPEDMDKKILALKKTDRFVRCSYSEIIRRMIELGMESKCKADQETATAPPDDQSA